MDNKLRETLNTLSDALKEDPRLKELAEKDQALNASEEVHLLSEKAKDALSEFAYNKDHFGEGHELTLKAQRNAYLAKKALDEHPLSKEYNASYKKVRELYDAMDRLLLAPYREKVSCRKV